jgi:serine/threonine protein kinase
MMSDENARRPTESLPSSELARTSIGQMYIERYEILGILGEGGMGIAYKAFDTKLDRLVALKVLLPCRLSNARDISRFEREAKTASRLSHPGIAKVFDFAVLNNDQPYLVMEFLDGKTLARLIETEGQLPVDKTLEIFIQICDALAYAHANGILHRDIKPSNIMVIGNGSPLTAKLLDFGIAKPMDAGNVTHQTMTETGELVGSPLHMSPEQARSAVLDGRSDLYSLGSSLYEALTGGPPHLGQTSIATLLKRETDKPLAMHEASLGRHFPTALEQLVSKLLKTNPDDRYQSANEVMQELIRIKSAASTDSKTDKHKQVSQATQTSKERPIRFLRILTNLFAFSVVGVLLTLSLSSLMQPGLIRLDLAPKPPAETSTPPAKSDGTDIQFFGKYSAAASIEFGDGLYQQHKYHEALGEYQNAAGEFERAHQTASAKYADLLTKIALCHQLLGEYHESANVLDHGLAVFQEVLGETNPMFAFSLTVTGGRFLQQNSVSAKRSFETAKPLFDRALSIEKKLDDPNGLERANLLKMQGIALLDRDFVNDARWRFEEALKTFHSVPGEPTDAFSITYTLTSLSDIYSRAKEYERIPALCAEMLARYEKFSADEKRKYADHFRKIADTLRMNGHHCKDPIRAYLLAEHVYEILIPVYAHSPDASADTLANVYDFLGSTYAREASLGKRERYQLAEKWLKQALNLKARRPNPDLANMSHICLKLTNVLASEGRIDESRSFCQQGINYCERSKGKNSILYGEALLYSGELDRTEGQPITAEKKFLEVLKICKSTGKTNTNVEGEAYANLGYCKIDRGSFAEAVAPLQQARKFYLKQFGLECKSLIPIDYGLDRVRKHFLQTNSIRDNVPPRH